MFSKKKKNNFNSASKNEEMYLSKSFENHNKSTSFEKNLRIRSSFQKNNLIKNKEFLRKFFILKKNKTFNYDFKNCERNLKEIINMKNSSKIDGKYAKSLENLIEESNSVSLFRSVKIIKIKGNL